MEAVQEITRSVVIHAGRERVWKALTSPEQISKWFEKFDFAQLKAGEPATMSDHKEIAAEIAIVEPMDRFGFRWQIAPPNPVKTLVIFTLETVPEGTRVTVNETGIDALPEDVRAARFADNVGGWAEKMPSLANYIEGK